MKLDGVGEDRHVHEVDHRLLGDEEYRALQTRLAANPQLGAIIKGGGGAVQSACRHWLTRQERGRPCHHYRVVRRHLIVMLFAYPKNVTADLTPKQVSQLARVVKEEFGDEEAVV